MTALIVCVALIAANVAYSIYDGRRMETDRQMDDFYRVEYKKSYGVKHMNDKAMSMWY